MDNKPEQDRFNNHKALMEKQYKDSITFGESPTFLDIGQIPELFEQADELNAICRQVADQTSANVTWRSESDHIVFDIVKDGAAMAIAMYVENIGKDIVHRLIFDINKKFKEFESAIGYDKWKMGREDGGHPISYRDEILQRIEDLFCELKIANDHVDNLNDEIYNER